MSRNFIFVSYAAVCLVGFATLFIANTYGQDTTPITATTAMMIVGFYSFFSTTCCFFLSARIKSEQDERNDYEENDRLAIWREFESQNQEHVDREREITRELEDLTAEVEGKSWSTCKTTTKK